MIADLKVDKARSRLIAGFVDSYLKLNETEKSLFAAAVNDLEEPRKEGVMEIVTSWMEEGIEKGIEQGIEKGIGQGRYQEASSLVLRLLTRRFGVIADATTAQFKKLTLSQLEKLAEDLLDFASVSDLQKWLAEQE